MLLKTANKETGITEILHRLLLEMQLRQSDQSLSPSPHLTYSAEGHHAGVLATCC